MTTPSISYGNLSRNCSHLAINSKTWSISRARTWFEIYFESQSLKRIQRVIMQLGVELAIHKEEVGVKIERVRWATMFGSSTRMVPAAALRWVRKLAQLLPLPVFIQAFKPPARNDDFPRELQSQPARPAFFSAVLATESGTDRIVRTFESHILLRQIHRRGSRRGAGVRRDM